MHNNIFVVFKFYLNVDNSQIKQEFAANHNPFTEYVTAGHPIRVFVVSL